MSKTSSTIRNLLHASSKGNISASFELYEHYYSGNGIEKNEAAAKAKLKECATILKHPGTKLTVDSIRLTDFRRLSKLQIDIDNKLTVLIGNNGTGKTSIVDSIIKTLSWLSANILEEGRTAKPLSYTDININSEHYAEVAVTFTLGANSFYQGSLARTIKGAARTKKSELSEIKQLANLYRVTNTEEKIDLPIFAYYSATRSSGDTQQTFSSEKLLNQKEISRFDAYEDALDGGSGNFSHFLKWFITLDNLSKNEKSPAAIKLKDEIKLLESLGEDQRLAELLIQKQQEYMAVISSENTYFSFQRQAIEQAIVSILPIITGLKVDRSSGRAELKAKVSDGYINITQLSDGQKVLTALAADLSRRLVTLNPHINFPLEGKGVVVVDEIELHLHPKWQQSILINLQRTFPKIQFIITTHSPQVLSVVDKSCIRLLEENDEDIVVTTPNYQTKGVMSSDILEQIMGTPATPQITEAKELEELHAYIEEGNYEAEYAQKLHQRLLKHFGKGHPVMVSCNAKIRLQELKRLARDRKSNIKK